MQSRYRVSAFLLAVITRVRSAGLGTCKNPAQPILLRRLLSSWSIAICMATMLYLPSISPIPLPSSPAPGGYF
ncbi:hypothetical protein BDW71DRAFT_182949 [Aspergillus fruticulosus]